MRSCVTSVARRRGSLHAYLRFLGYGGVPLLRFLRYKFHNKLYSDLNRDSPLSSRLFFVEGWLIKIQDCLSLKHMPVDPRYLSRFEVHIAAAAKLIRRLVGRSVTRDASESVTSQHCLKILGFLLDIFDG